MWLLSLDLPLWYAGKWLMKHDISAELTSARTMRWTIASILHQILYKSSFITIENTYYWRLNLLKNSSLAHKYSVTCWTLLPLASPAWFTVHIFSSTEHSSYGTENTQIQLCLTWRAPSSNGVIHDSPCGLKSFARPDIAILYIHTYIDELLIYPAIKPIDETYCIV